MEKLLYPRASFWAMLESIDSEGDTIQTRGGIYNLSKNFSSWMDRYVFLLSSNFLFVAPH